MKKNKLAFMIAAFAVFIAIGFITVMSVKTAGNSGSFGMPFIFSMGGRAKLRNTIEIPLSKADKLRMEYGSKNIKIYPAENDKITIQEYLYSDSPKALAEVAYGGDKEVTVTGGNSRIFVIFGFFIGEGERIEVYVPEKSLRELSIQSGSGNVTSETDCIREDGIFSVQTGSGNIRLNNAGAKEFSVQAGSGNINTEALSGEELRMKAGSGNIHIEDIEGNVTLQTGSGNIVLKKLAGGVNAEAGSGNVTVDAEAVSGDTELRAGSGNVRLELPEELDFHFSADTGSGNINTDFDKMLIYDKKGKNAEGDIGENPDINIRAKTNSGNINIVYR